jgi:hypothetical protein
MAAKYSLVIIDEMDVNIMENTFCWHNDLKKMTGLCHATTIKYKLFVTASSTASSLLTLSRKWELD